MEMFLTLEKHDQTLHVQPLVHKMVTRQLGEQKEAAGRKKEAAGRKNVEICRKSQNLCSI